MESLIPQTLPISLLGVPFDQKWELLKSTIERLYIRENRSLPDVIKAIKDQHGFEAAESHYKYQIKKWKIKKSTSTSKKAALYQVIQTRAQLGKSSAITRGGQEFDTKNLRRFLKNERRRAITLQPVVGGEVGDVSSFSGHITQSGTRIFMNWNMPYGAMRSSAARAVDHLSPLSDIVVTSPPSPHGAPSPMTLAVKEMTAVDRARLFVQGRHMELLKSMEKPQRVTMSTWMYQYWLFAFKTAKHWGRGPQDWTAGMLGFDEYHQRTTISISSPNTPGVSTGTPASHPTPIEDEMIGPTSASAIKIPSSLCRWSVHYAEMRYKRIPSPPGSPIENINLNDEGSWPTWPAPRDSKEFTKKLSDSLETNDFSNVRLDDLPIATDHIARAARGSPNELLEEALGFSIMSRNLELVNDLLENEIDIAGLHPFHLAVTYLDGSKTCCSILEALEDAHPLSLRKLYVNDLGHTVLDQLMIAILKAHTSCMPGVVDVIFKKEKRFEGEDVDICGRWDADSDCIRTLLANGTPGIPFEWKHMFCHTSVQTICHCIGTVFGPHWSPDINAPSGLFVRRCVHCGLKLQLLPLHTLVLVGLHLSRSGCENETLFGILACLLCLLINGANPLLKANISVPALLGDEEVNECSHEELDPAELAEKVTASLKSVWSRELRTGWRVIRNTLRHSQAEWKVRPPRRQYTSSGRENDDEFDSFNRYSEDEMSTDEEASHEPHLPAECHDVEYHRNFFGGNKVLASLWAAVQTELLTYRRLEEGDDWISRNFNMHTLDESLISRDKVDIALVQNQMMKSFCDCGEFPGATPACPILEEAAAYYFSNLDDWNRTTFIENPTWRIDYWYYEYK